MNQESGRPGHRRLRRVAVVVLLVVATIALLAGNVTIFLRRTLLDTDSFVATLQPLQQDEDVVAVLSDELATSLFDAIDARQLVEDALPDETEALAAPITAAVESFVSSTTERVLESDTFATIWEQALRTLHETAVAVLENDEGALTTTDGKVVLDLSSAVTEVADRLRDAGLPVPDDLDPQLGQIELYDSESLAAIQDAVDLLNRLAVVLWVAGALAFVGAIAVSTARRRTILAIGVVFAAAGLVTMAGLDLLREQVLELIRDDAVRAAASETYETVLRGFVSQSAMLLGFGVVLALGAWVTGPARAATWIRDQISPRLRGRGEQLVPSSGALGVVRRELGRHRGAWRTAVIVGGLVLLVAWDRPTLRVVLFVTVLVLLVLALVEVFADARPATDSA